MKMKEYEIECIICGKVKPRIYNKTCGSLKCINSATQQTNVKKYGHICSVNGDGPSRKRLATLKEHYGDHITNASQVKEVKEKKTETCRRNFGVDHPMQSSVIRTKSINTCEEKYGYDNCSKSQEVIDKIVKTKSTPDKNGKTIYQKAYDRRMITNYLRHGVFHSAQIDSCKRNYKIAMTERYGVDNYFKTDQFHESMIDRGFRYSDDDLTRLEKYRRDVYRLTEHNIRTYSDEIKNISMRSTDFHLDHIYSVSTGFKNNIDPELISCVPNLQILPYSLNISKQARCWITITELNERYNKWQIKHHII
jgi:hypothetical protein